MTMEEWKGIFAKRLSYSIERSGLSKKEVAELANISPGTISQYLNCTNIPTATVVSNLAHVLKVDIDYLLVFEEVVERTT